MRTLVACRACQHPKLEVYCDLGEQPLANAFVVPHDTGKPEARYPLALAHCPACWLSQLTVVIEPDQLYRNYHYVSGASPAWRDHCDALAATIPPRRSRLMGEAVTPTFVVEVASNDGTLLRLLKDRGVSVLGVEPAMNLTAAYPPDLQYLSDYFTDKTARWIKTRYGHADVVIAQNVMGHVDDAKGLLYAIKKLLRPKRGYAILEMPYLYAMLQRQEFPQVYHEHLSYWSLLPLQRLAHTAGLSVFDVKPLPHIHGGSMRYYLEHAGASHDGRKTVDRLAQHEREIQEIPDLIASFNPRGKVGEVEAELERYRGKTVWGYGASAKGTVLLNSITNADVVQRVVDDHVGKQGLLVPGVRTPIVKPQEMGHVDVVLVLAWNWADAIKQRAEALGFKGTYLIPFAA